MKVGNGERKEHFKELLISEDVLPEPCQNLCASLLTERTRSQRGCWEILVAVQLRGTGEYPLTMLIGKEKGRKTNLMRSESAWASANDGLHLIQQQCEQQSSGGGRGNVTLTMDFKSCLSGSVGKRGSDLPPLSIRQCELEQ